VQTTTVPVYLARLHPFPSVGPCLPGGSDNTVVSLPSLFFFALVSFTIPFLSIYAFSISDSEENIQQTEKNTSIPNSIIYRRAISSSFYLFDFFLEKNKQTKHVWFFWLPRLFVQLKKKQQQLASDWKLTLQQQLLLLLLQ